MSDSRRKRKRQEDILSPELEESSTEQIEDENTLDSETEKAVVVDSKSLKVRVKRVNVDKKEGEEEMHAEEFVNKESLDTNVEKEPEENPGEHIQRITEEDIERKDEYYKSLRSSKINKYARETAFYNVRLLMERHRIGPFYKDPNTNTVQVLHSFVTPTPIMEATIPDPDNLDLNIIDPDFITPKGYKRPELKPEDYDDEIGEPLPGVHRSIMDGYTLELKRELEHFKKMTPERNFYDTWQEQFLSQWKILQPSGVAQSYI